jgi:hypothetical protein
MGGPPGLASQDPLIARAHRLQRGTAAVGAALAAATVLTFFVKRWEFGGLRLSECSREAWGGEEKL